MSGGYRFVLSIVPMYTDRAWRLGARWRCCVSLQKTWKMSCILRMRPRKLVHASTMALRLTLAGATIATGFWMKGAGLVVGVGLAAESEAPCGTTGIGNVAPSGRGGAARIRMGRAGRSSRSGRHATVGIRSDSPCGKQKILLSGASGGAARRLCGAVLTGHRTVATWARHRMRASRRRRP